MNSELLGIVVATALGGLIGLERQIHGHWAGLRTHIGVALGSAVFALVGAGIAPLPMSDSLRVVQGIAAGIGFLGAGTILKLSDQKQVKGLTTASSIWLTSAIGTAAGLGLYLLALATTVISLVVLGGMQPLERYLEKHFPTQVPH
jgi:putative Mg2+ transporter-C (MgtC) family protein